MTDQDRRTPISQPTSERTSDQSTQSASGLSAERPGVEPSRPAEQFERGDNTDDPTMPADDSALNTKI